MYRVCISEYNNEGQGKEIDVLMKTEKLYELIGRYIIKYGIPEELTVDEGYYRLDFHLQYTKGFVGAEVMFCKVKADESKLKGVTVIKNHVAEIKKEDKPEQRIQEMIDANVFVASKY